MLVIDSITATYFKAAVNIFFGISDVPRAEWHRICKQERHKPLLPLNVPKSIVHNKVCMCNFSINVHGNRMSDAGTFAGLKACVKCTDNTPGKWSVQISLAWQSVADRSHGHFATNHDQPHFWSRNAGPCRQCLTKKDAQLVLRVQIAHGKFHMHVPKDFMGVCCFVLLEGCKFKMPIVGAISQMSRWFFIILSSFLSFR